MFRAGVAPLNIETLRYANNRYIPAEERLCNFCESAEIEDEFHALLKCTAYEEIRHSMFQEISTILPSFIDLLDEQKLVAMLGNPKVTKIVARGCSNILIKRNDIMYFKIIEDVINVIDETVFSLS